MKKGQTESYSFVIGLVITALLLTGIIMGAYQVFKPKGKEHFDNLAETLRELEEEKINMEGELPFYVEEDEVLIGFGKEQEYIGRGGVKSWFNWECYGIKFAWGIYTPLGVTGKILRPEKNCPIEKSCLCLCKIESVPYRVTENACQGNVKCETFDKLEFTGGKGCPQGVFIPGRKAIKGDEPRGLASIYYSKQGLKVSIDDEEALVGEELKEETYSHYFEKITNDIEACTKTNQKNCKCGVLDMEYIDEGYKIHINKDNENIKMSLINVKTDKLRASKKLSDLGLSCYKRNVESKKTFDDCKSISLIYGKIGFIGDCCSLADWQGKTEIYFLKEESKVYMAIKDKGYPDCKLE